jgi:head-tail adaptor
MRTKTRPHAIGRDEHLVTFEAPGLPVSDGEGGFTQAWTPLEPPTWYVRIRPATARDAEQTTAGTIITHVSHFVHGRFHPGVTTQARMVYAGKTYQITNVENLDLAGVEMELVADLQT